MSAFDISILFFFATMLFKCVLDSIDFWKGGEDE